MSSTEQLVPLLRIDDLGSYLRVPRKTIYQWRLRGDGPPAIKVGGQLRYRREDVECWLEERKALSHSVEPGGVAAVVDADARGGVVVVTGGGSVPNPSPGSSASHLAKGNRHGPSS